MDATDVYLRRVEPSALLTLEGSVHSLNAPMAATLGRPADQCVGRRTEELLPVGQRAILELLVDHALSTKRLAMRVMEFPRPGAAPVVCLVEARPVTSAQGLQLVWIHVLDTSNDFGSLLIPFRMAAEAADLALCSYVPEGNRIEWLGGAPALTALIPSTGVSLSWMVRRIHPDDREGLRRLMRSSAAESPWFTLRFRTDEGDQRHLRCHTRRIQLGHGGPERTFGVIRDDTRSEERQQAMMAALGAERQRTAEITSFASALISATTEQELRQIVLTRLAATFKGTGALLAFVHEDHLQISTDAGIPLALANAARSVSLDASSPLPYAIRSGEPQYLSGRAEYVLRWPQGVSAPWLGPDTALSVTPLGPAGDQPLGAWMVTYERPRRLSGDEQALMNTLAGLAGQALKRIRWQQACVQLANAVQQSMLAAPPDSLPGMEVAVRYRCGFGGLDIGGDWYDVFEEPGGTVVLVIGDVQGHDVDAAALMGQVRASMRAIAAHATEPRTVLTRTNELLLAMGVPRFASCTMLRVDPRNGRITGASAGHVPLLRVRDDGGYDIHQLRGGTVLGVLPGARYEQSDFTLDEHTSLIMVTDGIVEGPGMTLEAGLRRTGASAAAALSDGLGAEGVADRILDSAGTVGHLDDIAVLVIRLTGG
ncbi:SpoIIE family protein phosphatase [Streptomyces sp. NPDC053750]|uniref:SpoIIE family protein phosphatase n=1 Tax=Streptomyces sp. NPDC053750 TaxID=3365714 RepID=UPI0037D6F2A1